VKITPRDWLKPQTGDDPSGGPNAHVYGLPFRRGVRVFRGFFFRPTVFEMTLGVFKRRMQEGFTPRGKELYFSGKGRGMKRGGKEVLLTQSYNPCLSRMRKRAHD